MTEVPLDWRDWLPYGEAFRFVDTIEAIALPRRLATRTDYLRHDTLVAAHGVAEATVPGVLLAEQAAQSAWLLGRCSGWIEPGDRVLLGRLNCTFEVPAPRGARVLAEVELVHSTESEAGFRALLSSQSRRHAKIVLAVKRLEP